MNLWLFSAGVGTGIAAIMHLVCIYWGPNGYRFFGAGEHFAKLAEQGSYTPTFVTLGITAVLSTWATMALYAAKATAIIPMTRYLLLAVTGVFLLRGILGLILIFNPQGRSELFWLISSAICLVLGICYAIGLKQQWHSL
ncbi:hypothetical protein PA25_17470 [Pseudoalteromonas sp. A25]|uniref:hypothetical protein n=1 Tax=Pseudoalteromonas sp. A25 TaxID=116092 RepID=UPI00126092F3|nr:hypothetical protein [Pseudoalteromonas sp. A25]BBN81762.1 hypothetical protein PA25_17470 [Pseudoalteromonas sp. A25]